MQPCPLRGLKFGAKMYYREAALSSSKIKGPSKYDENNVSLESSFQ